ncbi:MAG TPA: DUF4956 domain-containing protein [Anaerolineae bacterium]|nr:DUF4956 domain-containing protein [Anaerolineae bacterium]
MDDLLSLTPAAPLSLTTLSINLLLGIVLANGVAWFYTVYGQSLSNRNKFAQNLPLLTLVTTLIIAVVKSSLALSLGLVGALSIVRFRTAIKETEELVYLFLAIAIGLGLGADQRGAVLIGVGVIMSYLVVRTLLVPRAPRNNLYLNVSTGEEEKAFSRINRLLKQHTTQADMRRFDQVAGGVQASYLIHCADEAALTALLEGLRAEFADGEFSFVEQNNQLLG